MTRRIKVQHVIPTLDQSGAEKQLAMLAAGLPKDRFEVRVCALTRGGFFESSLRDAGIPVDIIGKRLKIDPATFLRLTRCIREFAPDIVHTWIFAANCYGRVAARWAKVPHVIASERCVDQWKSKYHFAIDRFLVTRTDAVVVNSYAVADFYREQGIPLEKIRVIPNAIEPIQEGKSSPSGLGQDDAKRKEILEAMGIDPSASVIALIGRLWPQKRVQDLLWATDVLRISGSKFVVLIIGDGPRRAALERFSRRLELDRIVHFLGHRKDVDHLLRHAIDVVVIPSEFEGMPNVAMEAMWAGRPVIATRIPGMDELVVDGVTGTLVEPKQPFLLAKAMAAFLTDREARLRMGEAGQRRVHQLFSPSTMITRYAQLYEECVV
ncbi:MAG: glycosyltransferase [Planctomycetota bacterium]